MTAFSWLPRVLPRATWLRAATVALLVGTASWACGSDSAGPGSSGDPPLERLVVPDSVQVDLADTLTIGAQLYDSAFNRVEDVVVVWRSLTPTTASVSTDGLISAREVGRAKLLVTAGHLRDTVVVLIPPPVALIVIHSPDSVVVSATVQLWWELYDSAGTFISWHRGTVTFPDTSKVRVRYGWDVTGVAPGWAYFTVQVGLSSRRDSIQVIPRPASIEIANAPGSMVIGDTVRLQAVVRDSLGNILLGRPISWGGAADTAGIVVADRGGEVTATASAGFGATQSRVIRRVTDAPLVTAAAGSNHSCFISRAGTMYCAGFNHHGEAGPGSAATSIGRVSPRHDWREVTAAWHSTCALTTLGHAWCWGTNGSGQLGATIPGLCNNGAPCTGDPVAVGGSHTFTAIAGTYRTYCGLDGAGQAWCWGENTMSQLGIGPPDSVAHPLPTPVQQGGATYRQLASSLQLWCGLEAGGAVWCWGGIGFAGPGAWPEVLWPTPTRFLDTLQFQSISGGGERICGLAMSGDVVCWGGRVGNQLAPPETHPFPVPLASVEAGPSAVCGLAVDGAAWCNGWDNEGGRGDGAGVTPAADPPTPVAGGLRFRMLSSALHSCGITPADVAWCWGENGDFQLGGASGTQFAPVLVVGQP